MKFTCTQENLNQGLSIVSHIANKNINLPILGNVLIKSDDKMLRLMTTNLEIAIRCAVRGKIDESGEFTIPSKLFADYVSLLPKEKVDILQDGNTLGISCGSYQTKLHGVHASEFPLIPSVDEQYKFSVKASEFRKTIGQVLFAVAPNESRPEISGVLFRFSTGADGLTLTLAATDSYRLAEKQMMAMSDKHPSLSDPVSMIVPARTVAELVRILGVFKETLDVPERLEICLGESQVLFVYDSVELISRTIEGKYPDYRQLIPERFETEVVMEKNDLARAVKTASLFSKTGLNDVHFRFSPGKRIALDATNAQTGEHSVEIDGAVSGKENNVTVNFRYFLDGVNNIDGDRVALQLIDGMSPCVIHPYGEGKPLHDYLYIVMPIRQ